ncbi:MAG: hypothetical protein OSJ44_06215 [Lachnospiraceae bacterium]|nr:hypothetical protein [Lachnospiraceae bacterium]
MKKKIATMLIMCCLISGMITDSVVYGADCGAVLNPFSGENLDEIIDELEELTYLTEDYNFEYRVFTNPATNKEEIEIVNYGSWQLGNLANLVIPSMIDGKSVSRLCFFAPNGYVKSIEISDGINQISGNKKNFIKKYI